MADAAQVVPSVHGLDDGDNPEQPPLQRRKINDNCADEPDIVLLCDDGVELLAHKSRISAACELFDDMFRASRPDVPEASGSSATAEDLPVIPLLASSKVAQLVLPLAYRQPPSSLRDKEFETLDACINFAHRLGMHYVVDCLAMYLETFIKTYPVEIYGIACRMDLDVLKRSVLPIVIEQHNLSDPYSLAEEVGLQYAQEIHEGKMANIQRLYNMLSSIGKAARREGNEMGTWTLNCCCPNTTTNNDMTLYVASLYQSLYRITMGADATTTFFRSLANAVGFANAVEQSCPHWDLVRNTLEEMQGYLHLFQAV